MKSLLLLTLSGSALALALLALRYLLLRRMPSTVYYYAYLLVLLRLALPLPGLVPTAQRAAPAASAAVVVSARPGGEVIPDEIPEPAAKDAPAGNAAAEPVAEAEELSPAAVESPKPVRPRLLSLDVSALLMGVWLFGMLASLGFTLISYISFTARLRRSLQKPEAALLALYASLGGKGCALYRSRAVKTPVMYGVFAPKIVLPAGDYSPAELRGILRHELTHNRRRDALYKWVSEIILSAHWFNPLSYVIRRELGRACELSCDEALLRGMSREEKQLYGDTLLRLAASGALPPGVVATTFSTEKRNLKERLEQIMHYRRGAPRVLSALLALALLAGCAVGAGPAPAPSADAPRDGAPVNGEIETFRVSDVDGLLAAIGPNRLILLDEGEYDFSKASSYGTSGVYYDWNLVSRESGADEYELVIHNADNLSLFGAGMGKTVISAEPRYANVLHFYQCRGLTLSDLTVGHTIRPGFCRGGVIELVECSEASVLYCALYGCGTIGVNAADCADLSVSGCEIYACSYSAVSVQRCRNVRVSLCEIDRMGTRPGEGAVNTLFSADYTNGFTVSDCELHDNAAQYLLRASYTENAFFLSNEVHDNRVDTAAFSYEAYPGVVDGCAFGDNELAGWVLNYSFLPLDSEGHELDAAALEAMTLRSLDTVGAVPPVSVEKATELAPGESVTVKTVDDFLKAIGPDRTILLDGALFDLSEASNYGSKGGEYYYWKESHDGPELVIHDVSGLTIRAAAAEAMDCVLSAVPRYADVLTFENCTGIRLAGFTAGHTREPGVCAGGVLNLSDCRDFAIDDCRLYGCGILGLQTANCRDLRVTGTEIFECSQGAGQFFRTSDLRFTDCDIHDVPSPALSLRECQRVSWNDTALVGEYFDLAADGTAEDASSVLTSAALEEMRLRSWNGRELSSPDSIAALQNPYYDETPHSVEPDGDKARFTAEVQQLIAGGSWAELSKRILFPVQVFSGDRAFHLWTPQDFVSSMDDEGFLEANNVKAFQSKVAEAPLEEYGNCLYGETFAGHLLAFIAQDNGNGVISYRINCLSMETPLWPGNPPESAPQG